MSQRKIVSLLKQHYGMQRDWYEGVVQREDGGAPFLQLILSDRLDWVIDPKGEVDFYYHLPEIGSIMCCRITPGSSSPVSDVDWSEADVLPFHVLEMGEGIRVVLGEESGDSIPTVLSDVYESALRNQKEMDNAV